MVITLVRLGKWLEERAKRQTTAAIRALHALRPDVAHLIDWDGSEKGHVWSTSARRRPFGGAPGRARAGRRPRGGRPTQVDESMLTGEPPPVAKGPGDR